MMYSCTVSADVTISSFRLQVKVPRLTEGVLYHRDGGSGGGGGVIWLGNPSLARPLDSPRHPGGIQRDRAETVKPSAAQGLCAAARGWDWLGGRDRCERRGEGHHERLTETARPTEEGRGYQTFTREYMRDSNHEYMNLNTHPWVDFTL